MKDVAYVAMGKLLAVQKHAGPCTSPWGVASPHTSLWDPSLHQSYAVFGLVHASLSFELNAFSSNLLKFS